MRSREIFHYTSNCKSITRYSEIKKMIDESEGSLWIIGDYRTLKRNNPWFKIQEVKDRVRSTAEDPSYVARDGITFVKKVQ